MVGKLASATSYLYRGACDPIRFPDLDKIATSRGDSVKFLPRVISLEKEIASTFTPEESDDIRSLMDGQ